MSADLRQGALALARRGWRVHPVTPAGKTPLWSDWPNRATSDEVLVDLAWQAHPRANIGVATGPSRLAVIDLDGPQAVAAWRQLCAGKEAPRTLTAATGRGYHLWYGAPKDRTVRNSAGRLAPGIDVRGQGGYVIGPPSVHPSGVRYRWSHPGHVLAAPDWLLDLLDPPAPARPVLPPTEIRAGDRYVAAAIRSEAGRVAASGEGGRNHALNAAAFALATLVPAGRITEPEIVAALTPAALSCGLTEREISRTIGSGLRAGAANPREAVA